MRPARFAREIGNFWRNPLSEAKASMRPARFAREIETTARTWYGSWRASMRPARFAREINMGKGEANGIRISFNEARAFCAGNSITHIIAHLAANGFNEARAFCAGN